MIGLTLRQQVALEAKQRGRGWETIVDELCDLAIEISGSNRPVSGGDFKMICSEVFRSEG